MYNITIISTAVLLIMISAAFFTIRYIYQNLDLSKKRINWFRLNKNDYYLIFNCYDKSFKIDIIINDSNFDKIRIVKVTSTNVEITVPENITNKEFSRYITYKDFHSKVLESLLNGIYNENSLHYLEMSKKEISSFKEFSRLLRNNIKD